MNFDELIVKVKAATVGGQRMTDVKEGKYKLTFLDGDKVALISDKNHKVNVTGDSLAALRIALDTARAKTLTNTTEARDNSDVITNFQTAVMAEGSKITKDTIFEVVHRLRIKDQVNEKPGLIYKNQHYKGFAQYTKDNADAFAMPSTTPAETAARNAAYNQNSAVLHASGLKDGITEVDTNLQLMPVFYVGG